MSANEKTTQLNGFSVVIVPNVCLVFIGCDGIELY